MSRRKSIPVPPEPYESNVLKLSRQGDFRRLFAQSAVRHNFCLTLTGPMLETLCAIADGCVRDREYHWTFSAVTPGNFVTSCEPLIKRGLVYHEPTAVKLGMVHGPAQNRSNRRLIDDSFAGREACFKLTPIGEAFVALLKVAGLFVKCDAAIAREAHEQEKRP